MAEKKRIVDSCFQKVDPDGALQESYISHVRITEDGNYQSTPPPPDAPREVKKDRVIIISVKKSGRVRLHKARENGNGTFSIGKTWPLDELTAIMSFVGLNPRSPLEAQEKSWAGDRGFIVTLGKNYYWQANSSEERLIFCASLTKIYIKYTGGRQPRLSGFTDDEMATILQRRPIAQQSQSSSQQLPRPTQPQKLPSATNNMGPSANGRPMPPPMAQRQPTDREPPRPSTGNTPQSSQRQPRPQASVPSFGSGRPSTASSATQPPQSRYDSGADPSSSGTRQPPLPNDRRAQFENRNQASFNNRRDEVEPPPPRSRGGTSNGPSMPGGFPDEASTPTSERVQTPEGSFISRAEILVEDPIPPIPAALPERRRPPLNIGDRPGTSDSTKQPMIPAPLATPSSQRDFMRPPARSNDRPEPPQPLRVKPGLTPVSMEKPGSSRGDSPIIAPNIEEKAKVEPLPALTASPVKPPALKIEVQTPTSPEPIQPPPEEERPGLGPMIKKKSKADVANAFRKMASAASASQPGFKPRAGGAAERLRELALQAKAAEGPDGITSVVPAPSLLRRATEETSRPSTADPAAVKKPSLEISTPEVKITSASEQNLPATRQPTDLPLKSRLPEKKAKESKKKMLPESTKKDLASLGIDPALVSDERSVEFASILDDFGWKGEGVHTKPIEELQDEISRELHKAQIGGWLDRLDEEDERVENMKRDIDAVIAEAEELDGLLTLYSVELGTLTDDIAYIEAQGQGLQIHAANQKLLAAEIPRFIEQRERDKRQAELDRQREIQRQKELERELEREREASLRSVDSPVDRESMEGVDRVGSLRRRDGMKAGEDEEKEARKKKMGAWKSVRKKFH